MKGKSMSETNQSIFHRLLHVPLNWWGIQTPMRKKFFFGGSIPLILAGAAEVFWLRIPSPALCLALMVLLFFWPIVTLKWALKY
jgi:hypothetical protein